MKNHPKSSRNWVLTLVIIVAVIAIAYATDDTGLFRGQFYFNSQQAQIAAKKIDITLPENIPISANITNSSNSPYKIDLTNDSKQTLIAVFELDPSVSTEVFSPNRLVLNVASNGVKTNNIHAEAYFAHKPNCEFEEPSICPTAPDPEGDFQLQNSVINPESDTDILLEYTASNWEIDPNDWRYDRYGNKYYIAVYADLLPAAGVKQDDVKSIMTSIKYLGNSKKPFGVSGLPTEYQLINVYSPNSN